MLWTKECSTCQTCKVDLSASPGLLQPLLIPTKAWESISIDFVKGLPNSKGKNVVMMVVDRLTKYGHFLGLSYPFTGLNVAHEYMAQIYKLHGVPESIISNRDKISVSNFWQELFK